MGISTTIKAVFPALTPEGYRRHRLHESDRIWPETNCYADLWIEVLNSLQVPPEAMLAFTLTQDFEGDQFTFFKVPLEDLETLYDIRVTELAIFDSVEGHIETQIARGRLCLLEMDSFYMPDTAGTAYRSEHGKTTIAVNRLDRTSKRIEYFHNGGYFALNGDDYDGLFQLNRPEGDLPFLPYTEFARLPQRQALSSEALREITFGLLAKHFKRRPDRNPLQAFSTVFPQQVEALADRPFEFFHKYAFNTLRQFGANFELAGEVLDWASPQFSTAAGEARRIAEVAKSVQFQLARAITRQKFEPLRTALEPAIEAWDALMQRLAKQL
ncbi:DUF1839 family protein [Oryzifoliimicrobium ureilyticus]|uniref:DUF1839 family protein n=1 Tax=Oryzifoliimicrobium ureilyticus TaxID=3113724 RepID=UPI0030760FC7